MKQQPKSKKNPTSSKKNNDHTKKRRDKISVHNLSGQVYAANALPGANASYSPLSLLGRARGGTRERAGISSPRTGLAYKAATPLVTCPHPPPFSNPDQDLHSGGRRRRVTTHEEVCDCSQQLIAALTPLSLFVLACNTNNCQPCQLPEKGGCGIAPQLPLGHHLLFLLCRSQLVAGAVDGAPFLLLCTSAFFAGV